MVIVEITRLKCLRCGHKWVPTKEEIRICPKCKSPYWDRRRQNAKNQHNSTETK